MVAADAVVMVELLYGALVGTVAILLFKLLVADADAVPDEGFPVAVTVANAGKLDYEANTASTINAGPKIV